MLKNLNFFYGPKQVLKNISMPIYENRMTALIGPSGCGKTTMLRCFNRMHDLYATTNYQGEILLHPNPQNRILHTEMIGEMNGYIHALLVRRAGYERGETVLRPARVYEKWVEPR